MYFLKFLDLKIVDYVFFWWVTIVAYINIDKTKTSVIFGI